eukprot:scaffold44965_cov47-Attheya_sp.AAC.1
MTTKQETPQQQPYDSCGTTTNNNECHDHTEEERGDFIGLERRRRFHSQEQQHEHETQHHLRPILVGYAFGPKKLKTMGIVMAEASKAVSTIVMAAVPIDAVHDGDSPCHDDDVVVGDVGAKASSKSSCQDNGVVQSLLVKTRQDRMIVDSNAGNEIRMNRTTNSSTSNDDGGAMQTNDTMMEQQQQQQQKEESIVISPLTDRNVAAATSITQHASSPLSLSLLSSSSLATGGGGIRFSMSGGPGGTGGIRNIVRLFRSSCSSAASMAEDSSSIATTTATTSPSWPPSSSSSSHYYTTTTTTTTPRSPSDRLNNMTPHLTPPETTTTSTHLNHPIRVSFVPLDLDLPLEEQHGGNFDAILHKMTEDILLLSKISSASSCDSPLSSDTTSSGSSSGSGSGSSSGEKDENQLGAIERVERLNKYQRDHPACCLVDHPRNIQAVMSRSDIAHILSSALQNICTESGIPVRAPRFLVHDGVGTMVVPTTGNDTDSTVLAGRVQEAPFSYPLIAKPLAAAGTSESHKMVIVLRPSGLDCILPMPSLLQEYANHDGVLYKVYVLGDTVRVFARPSLPNLPEGDVLLDFVEFDSQRPYPTLTDFLKVHHMTNPPTTTFETATDQNKRKMDAMTGEERFERKREKVGKVSWTDNKASTAPTNGNEAKVTAEDIRPVVSVLRNAFGLELFGFDVILSGNEMLVVDVNYFPSYKEVSNFSSLLAQYLTQRAIEGRMQSFSSS